MVRVGARGTGGLRSNTRWTTLCVVVAGILWLLLSHALAQQLDITKLLLSRPGVSEKIADLCNHACAGNERKSWLEKATLTIAGASAPMTLEVLIKLQSRHVPFRGVVLYDDTANLTVTASLDPVTCQVTDVKLSSNNDLYQLVIGILGPSLAGQFRAIGAAC
jgi:hypothetical protein